MPLLKPQNNEQVVETFMGNVIRIRDPRTELVYHSHYYYFHIYFSDYVKYEIAPFQKEMFRITEDESISLAVIVAFRESAKSTIMTMSYVLWSIMGKQQCKHVLILSQTQEQARLHFKNLKRELEHNLLLRNDLGPWEEDEWNANSIVLKKYNARITVASSEQSIRGMRHGQYRPQLIVADDIEDSNSVKTKESRDNTYNWFNTEVVPLGAEGTKIILVGNLLHEDSLIKRLQKEIEDGERDGIFRQYPIVDEKGKSYWPGRFPTAESIENKRRKIADPFAWNREYKLQIIDNREKVIKPGWIKRYQSIPEPLRGEYADYGTGVDLANSEKKTGDHSAFVTARIIGHGDDRHIYVLPHPLDIQVDFPTLTRRAKLLCESLGGKYENKFYVEQVAFQGVYDQQLREEGLRSVGVKIGGMDKRERLIMISRYIENGTILFPTNGTKDLEDQLVNFGTTKHDDLCDALTILILGLNQEGHVDVPRIIDCDFWGSRGSSVSYTPRVYHIGGSAGKATEAESNPRPISQQNWDKFIDDETRSEFGR